MIHHTPVRIYYEDTDCGGVVYYANYLRYFERARTHFLDALGFDLAALLNEGVVFVVTEARIRYRSPARYGDELRIESRITDVGGASIVFEHRVEKPGVPHPLVSGTVRCAVVDPDGRVRRLSPDSRAKLETAVEPRAF